MKLDEELLSEVVRKWMPELLPSVREGGIRSLTADQRSALRQAITSELCETGLNPDDEPNNRGLALEELIDVIGYE